MRGRLDAQADDRDADQPDEQRAAGREAGAQDAESTGSRRRTRAGSPASPASVAASSGDRRKARTRSRPRAATRGRRRPGCRRCRSSRRPYQSPSGAERGAGRSWAPRRVSAVAVQPALGDGLGGPGLAERRGLRAKHPPGRQQQRPEAEQGGDRADTKGSIPATARTTTPTTAARYGRSGSTRAARRATIQSPIQIAATIQARNASAGSRTNSSSRSRSARRRP